jgi:hypothetical protein
MGEMIYNALSKYYHALSLKGYMPETDADKLLVLIFLRDFVFADYRGYIKEADYHLIEKALDCLYGTTCLIPYPDYLKMGKLYLGQITEMAERLKTLENTEVIKLIKDLSNVENNTDSDVMVVVEE